VRGRGFRFAVAASVTAAALVACSSGAGGGTRSSSGATASRLSLMIITPTATAGVNYPEALGAARAAVRALDARGGIQGHPVDLLYCNPKNDAPTAQDCAQEAVDKHVLAVISEFSATGGVTPTLEQAGIPSVASAGISTDASDLTSKVSFVINPLVLYPAVCPALLKKAGATRPAVLGYDLAASDQLLTLATVGAKAVGLAAKPVLRVPITTSDFTPTVTQLTAAKANGAVLVLTEPGSFAVMKGAGSKVLYCHSAAVIPRADLTKLGPVADNLVEASVFPELTQTAQFSELRRMISELDADYRAGDADAAPALRSAASSTNAWLAVQIVAKVGAAVSGKVTASSLLARLNRTSGLDLQLIPPLDFATPDPIPGMARVFNTTLRGIRWNAAQARFVPLGPETYPALTILANGAH
jgi:ABC-type branched-subunit amino acid transport system substrate-binding protein